MDVYKRAICRRLATRLAHACIQEWGSSSHTAAVTGPITVALALQHLPDSAQILHSCIFHRLYWQLRVGGQGKCRSTKGGVAGDNSRATLDALTPQIELHTRFRQARNQQL